MSTVMTILVPGTSKSMAAMPKSQWKRVSSQLGSMQSGVHPLSETLVIGVQAIEGW
jgi:hypothetical protein